MKIDEKITSELERAMSSYNTAIKRLTTNHTRENENKAYETRGALRGMRDMLFTATGIFVTFEYLDNAYYSEIVAYYTTVTVDK